MTVTELWELWKENGDAALTEERTRELVTDGGVSDGMNPDDLTSLGIRVYNHGYTKKAAVLFRMAAERGSTLGKYFFGFCILEGLVPGSGAEDALPLLNDNDVLEKTDAAFFLYQIYRDGKYGLAKDPEKEKQYFDIFFGFVDSGRRWEKVNISVYSEKCDDLERAFDETDDGYLHSLDSETVRFLFTKFVPDGKVTEYLSGKRRFEGVGSEWKWNYQEGVNTLLESSKHGCKKASAFLKTVIREGYRTGQYESYESLKARFESKKEAAINEIGRILFCGPSFLDGHPDAQRILRRLVIEIRDSAPDPLPIERDEPVASPEETAAGIASLRDMLKGKAELREIAGYVDELDDIFCGRISESDARGVYDEIERFFPESHGIPPDILNALLSVFINVRAVKNKEHCPKRPHLGSFDCRDAERPRIVLYVGTIKELFPESPAFENRMVCTFVHEMIHAVHYAMMAEKGGTLQRERFKDRLLIESIARGGEAVFCSETLGDPTIRDRFLAEFTMNDARIWPYAGAKYLVGSPNLLGSFFAKSLTDWDGACDDLTALRRVRDSIPGLYRSAYLPAIPTPSKKQYTYY